MRRGGVLGKNGESCSAAASTPQHAAAPSKLAYLSRLHAMPLLWMVADALLVVAVALKSSHICIEL